ncbi:protein kinase putative [Entamoeba histolytica]|uniref:Aurora kinase n=2 Tax=Entamoeba histolytica TaxID=5759 RepID=C4MB42_ENTH1|nr:protein kinase, putative [Entamoeba histolytica HM-1:IMSS]EAL44121.1 protein kinase, putative [Entamoeba histolytica HM-1:IMSS]GAT99123.1 protein kinase putative [Entamoeba histolytica]|eukprot:XP_649507.1 protein kinase, putative [Entamoeba histolytica HM-1:IMSS]
MFSFSSKTAISSKSQQYIPTKPMAAPRRVEQLSVNSPLKKEIESKPKKDDEKKPTQLSLDMFDIGKPLGQGKFGNVYLVKYKKYDYVCALKVIFKRQLQKCEMGIQMKREIELQSHLNHPNILKLFGFFEDKNRWFLVLEYCKKGELYRLLQQAGRFDERRAARYIKATTEALKYCQEMNCIHRDLKPENIMIDHNDQVKLADFGWSVQAKTKRNTYCGTLDYLCPEIVLEKYYDGSIGQWCLGVLTFELCTGEPPFQSNSREEVMKKVRNVKYSFPSYLTNDCKDFINKLIQYDPSKRMSFAECLVHPWIVKNTTN